MDYKERKEIKNEIVSRYFFEDDEEKEEIAETFNTFLTAKVGDTMYFLDIKPSDEVVGNVVRLVVRPEKSKIIKVQIIRLVYVGENRLVVLYGKDENGKIHNCAQEYFFESQELAREAIEKLCKYYRENDNEENVYDVYDNLIPIKHRYSMEFSIDPYDIILEANSHYTVKSVFVIMEYQGVIQVNLIQTKEHKYIAGKKIRSAEFFKMFTLRKL